MENNKPRSDLFDPNYPRRARRSTYYVGKEKKDSAPPMPPNKENQSRNKAAESKKTTKPKKKTPKEKFIQGVQDPAKHVKTQKQIKKALAPKPVQMKRKVGGIKRKMALKKK